MDLGLEGRVAIVGGGSHGMGRATAAAVLREGARVTICARREEGLLQAAREMGGDGWEERILPVAADLARAEDIARVVERTRARWGRVDVAVNNTGGPPPGQAVDMADTDWVGAFEMLFFYVARMCREVTPAMQQQGWGRIVNILSLSIRQPEDNLALSTVARTAALAYVKVLSTELAPSGITVNNVLPGSIETDRLQLVAEMQARFHGRDLARAMEDRRALVPMGRFGRPEEVADLVCFLASDRAGFMTGLSVSIDGGQLRATV